MMMHLDPEFKRLLDLLSPWFNLDDRDEDYCPSLKPDTPEELKALYPRYKKLNKKVNKLDWANL